MRKNYFLLLFFQKLIYSNGKLTLKQEYKYISWKKIQYPIRFLNNMIVHYLRKYFEITNTLFKTLVMINKVSLALVLHFSYEHSNACSGLIVTTPDSKQLNFFYPIQKIFFAMESSILFSSFPFVFQKNYITFKKE